MPRRPGALREPGSLARPTIVIRFSFEILRLIEPVSFLPDQCRVLLALS
jgi:hypothetical protein